MQKNNLKDLINEFWESDYNTQIEFKNYINDLFGAMSLQAQIGNMIQRIDD